MSKDFDARLEKLREDANAERLAGEKAYRRANEIEAEIHGMLTARSMLCPDSEPTPEKKGRRPRRDIRALVKEFLDRPRTFVLPSDPVELAEHITNQIPNVRKSQVEAALVVLRANGETT
jgi:hypothetical protein